MTTGYDFATRGSFPERRVTYNAENMPASLTLTPPGGSATTVTLTYDGEGRRVKKQNGTNTVLYVDRLFEIRNGQPVKYIFAGDTRIARIMGGEVHFYHQDHLGSSTLVTKGTGTILDSNAFEPFGRVRGVSGGPDRADLVHTFTGQEFDAESGLYNYGARLYDPVLGRFISADSVMPVGFDPQALDRYAYARNNPLKYVDPDGHEYADALRVWNGFMANPDSSRYGIPRQVSMWRGQIRDSMPFTDRFLNRLAWMDSRGVDVTQLTHGQLGQEYHQEVIEQISLVSDAAALAGAAVESVANAAAPKTTPDIKWSAQEKHFPGHNSYTPGRSTMTADPTKIAEKAGTGQQVGKIPGICSAHSLMLFFENWYKE
jgi:RHS repeat-associated protein